MKYHQQFDISDCGDTRRNNEKLIIVCILQSVLSILVLMKLKKRNKS